MEKDLILHLIKELIKCNKNENYTDLVLFIRKVALPWEKEYPNRDCGFAEISAVTCSAVEQNQKIKNK